REASGLQHRAVYLLPIRANPSASRLDAVAILWWLGQPFRGLVWLLQGRADLCLCPQCSLAGLIYFCVRLCAEVLSLMLAWSVMICRGGARARARGHSVISILLVAQNQHQATTIQADLLRQ